MYSSVSTITNLHMNLTQNAITQISSIFSEDPDNYGKHLRIYVQGGGCAGFEYGFMIDDEINEDDFVICDLPNAKVVVDSISANYLQGASIDYVDELIGARFTIDNPKAISTCGCGSSFSYDFDEADYEFVE